MIEEELHKQVTEGYQQINNYWMRLHFHLLVWCTWITGILEIVMYFIIDKSGGLSCPASEYWIKYIVTPVSLNIGISLLALLVYRNKKAPVILKQYMISFLFVFLAFVLALMHSGFIAVLVTAVFPVLMTIMYEDQKLTFVTAAMSVTMQFISGYFVFWDQEKVLDSSYIINLIILLTATFSTWFTCYFMIGFIRKKREIIINNDIERFQLQIKVNIDGLTNVGNKLALMSRLEENAFGSDKICCLAMLDVDEFKEINDNYGHLFGDDVLRYLGEGMRNIPIQAEAFRYGGDEFCILFWEPSMEIVIKEVAAVQKFLQDSIAIPDNKMSLAVSAGIASYEDHITPLDLLRKADHALYESKKQQGNQITIYHNCD